MVGVRKYRFVQKNKTVDKMSAPNSLVHQEGLRGRMSRKRWEVEERTKRFI